MTGRTRTESLDRVLAALADPTRRALLEQLRDRPGSTTGELARFFPLLTRWAVMKHLRSLEAAGLVQTLPQGRLRRHFREDSPLREVSAWLDRHGAGR